MANIKEETENIKSRANRDQVRFENLEMTRIIIAQNTLILEQNAMILKCLTTGSISIPKQPE